MRKPNEMTYALWILVAILIILVYFGRGVNWNVETWVGASTVFVGFGILGTLTFEMLR